MARRKKHTEPTCAWTFDEGRDSDSWDTDCGNKFIVNEGTPRENHMTFCCYCGRPIKEKRH